MLRPPLVVPLDVSESFISVVAEIGVLLLLLVLGLAYSAEELRSGMRSGMKPGLLDGVLNFLPGCVAGFLLGWKVPAAVLLGGVSWVSSSGIVAKVLGDLDRLGNRETPAILNILVMEDLAMAVFLPIAGALANGDDLSATTLTVGVALAAVGAMLVLALHFGDRLSAALSASSDESLLLAVFGLTLLVGGLAQQLDVSAARGAFLVGLALSGSVQARTAALISPLRDLFAAVFFVFFSFQIYPGDLVGALLPATLLASEAVVTKFCSGWYAAAKGGAGHRGRARAGVTLTARGELSIVIASLGARLPEGPELGRPRRGVRAADRRGRSRRRTLHSNLAVVEREDRAHGRPVDGAGCGGGGLVQVET